jgi:putative transposase
MLYTHFMDEPSCKSNRNVFSACHSHVVWCPKYRRKVLVPPIDERLKQIIGEVCEKYHAQIEEREVMSNHVQRTVRSVIKQSSEQQKHV